MHIRRARGPSRLAAFAAARESSARIRDEKSDGPRSSLGKPARASGYKCMCVADGRERGPGERESRVLGEARDLLWRPDNARGNAHRTRAPVRKESVEMENADGAGSHGETHLIIARFRHLAPALNNALPLHSLTTAAAFHPSFVRVDGSTGRRGPWRV